MSESSLLPYYKTPNEKYTTRIDFTGSSRLPSGATLSSVAAVAKDVTDEREEVATSTILQGTPASVAHPYLSVNFAAGGDDAHDYRVQCLVTCSDGSILEEVLDLKVRKRY